MSAEKPGTEHSERLTTRGDESSASEREHVEDFPDLEQRRAGDPDLSLDVPKLNIEEIELEVKNLLARVSLNAEVADFVKINVGVDVRLDEVRLAIKGVAAQAHLEVKMERVLETLNRALEAIDHNPQVLDGSARRPRRNVTEAARREAERLSVDLSDVTGTGRDGRILVKDVQKAASNRE